ncbi:efflux RND transporter periplasmic adaptor subunit [Desulfoluna sp.]|uniref:efflux RND transporter periplasmic adaptor subunit n=1 Tax=Desulfoluna sp. TaxID=2045199 RepID=UPI00260A90BA|nr:efflux RND transporter periplasmic adaptor subunit [Desulfoluna sp.]
MPEKKKHKKAMTKALLCTLVLLGGAVSMTALASLKKPPKENVMPELKLAVDVTASRPQEVQSMISGYGEVQALNTVALAPERSGRVVAIHPRLEEGEVIDAGEVLFRLDTEALMLEKTTATRRLVTLTRNRDLLKKEYERTQTLFENMKTGSLTAVETAEQNYNSAKDSVDQQVYVLAETNLNLKKSVIRAPFKARVKTVSIEKEHYVTAGTEVITLADDAILEMAVPIKGDEAATYLAFDENSAPATWFGTLKKNRCQVSWTNGMATASGTLDRVIRYDTASRTVYVAIRIDQKKQVGFPVTEGMFCKASIPGRTFDNLIPLPSHAVSYDGKVYVAEDGRLKTVQVDTPYTHEGFTYVSSGLAPGAMVITSRLTSPLEGALLTIQAPKELAAGDTP